MNKVNTFEAVKAIVIEVLGCEESEVTPEASLIDDLGADSLSAVEMMMALEDEFDITISEDASRDAKTVGDIVSLIESLI